MLKLIAAAAVVAGSLVGPANADDLATVKAFYSDLLSHPAATTEKRFNEVISPDVVSIPTPPGGEGAKGMLNTIHYLGKVVPDLTWVPQEIIDVGGGRFVVRSRFHGTPVGPFFSVEKPTGKSFDAMSIDIVTVKNGQIVHTYHLEDWLGAIAQLTAK